LEPVGPVPSEFTFESLAGRLTAPRRAFLTRLLLRGGQVHVWQRQTSQFDRQRMQCMVREAARRFTDWFDSFSHRVVYLPHVNGRQRWAA